VPDEVDMADKTIQLTPKGLAKIKEELRYLKDERRQELTEYMGAALADGDLRENAAYDEARLLQSANETRIADLEEIGASLHLEDDQGTAHVFHLVGSLEADVFENRISDESPLGRQLVGRRAGDQINLGKLSYRVTSVMFE